MKILKFFDADPGSGMETVRIRDPGWKKVGSGIRDGKKSNPGSGINIPDPQHWYQPYNFFFWLACSACMKILRWGPFPVRRADLRRTSGNCRILFRSCPHIQFQLLSSVITINKYLPVVVECSLCVGKVQNLRIRCFCIC